jgi:hypothetical protein
MRYDEKSLFPKSILDMEAKMKATHALGMGVSRASRRMEAPRIRVHDVNPTRRPSNWNKVIMKRNKNEDD